MTFVHPKTQKVQVLNHIKRFGSISPREAIDDYGITRLAARILDLKKEGHDFEVQMRQHQITKKRYARYTLVV